MSVPAVALSAASLATTRGAPAWLLAACAAHTVLLSGGGAVARSVAAALAFRAALLLATLLHEWAHVLAGALVGVPLLSAANLLGNQQLRAWAALLKPFGSGLALAPCVVPPVGAGRHGGSAADAAVAAAGWAFSVCLALAVTEASERNHAAGSAGDALHAALLSSAAAAAWIVALGATASDARDVLALLWNGSKLQAFRCGNFGVLLAAAAAGSTDAVALLERMAEITMGRGGQSGGVATFLPTASGLASVRARVRPGRREAMHTLLSSTLKRRLNWASLTHRRSSTPSPRLYIGHTRFATSSLPSVGESHPHQWTPPRQLQVWRVRDGAAAVATETLSVFITHNGDFDFLNLYGRERTHNDVAQWLARVLHSPPPAHCDSACVAGCMELYRTEGAWLPALRLAYQTAVAESFEEAFDYQAPSPAAPNAAPAERVLAALAATADAATAAFLRDRAGQLPSGAASLAQLLLGAEAALADALAAAMAAPACDVDVAQRMEASKLSAFATAAVDAFLHGDLFSAMRRFMGAARGSFGLCAACSLDSDRLSLAALNQPMGVAFAPDRGTVVYASEANALAVRLADDEAGKGGATATWRFDIDNVAGEVLELRWAAPPAGGAEAVPASELGDAGTGGGSPGEAFWPFLQQYGCALRLRVHNVRSGEGLTLEALRSGGRLVDTRDNPYLASDAARRATTMRSGAGRCENDLRDCGRVLSELRRGWSAAGSLNGASADGLFALLKARAIEAAAEEAKPMAKDNRLSIDVLVTGVESSLWVAEQFASDMQNMFPHLRVVAISANKVIGVLGNARGAISAAGFSFCRLTAKLERTICIAVSHSGQTFPTLHATAILQRACPGRVFVVTGAVDSKMGAAVGQSLAQGAPFGARIFSTGAGWRAAEPASVSALATHHLLTEVLLHLARRMLSDTELAAKAASPPLGLRLTTRDVEDLSTIADAFVDSAVPCLTGVDAAGKDVSTPARDALLAQGRVWGWHVLEAPVVWTFVATYIFLAVVWGCPFFRVMLNFGIRTEIGEGIHYDWWRPDFTAPEWFGRVKVFTALYYVAGVLDAGLFIFLPAIATLTLRWVQGRQVLARVKGRRCVVIADVPYVHQLAEIYLSKLFSLSFGIAGVDVHGANAVDSFVHRYTHRVARGILLAFGRPDGRLCSQTKSESWVLMGMLQARTIANMGAGPEVVTVGHNPHKTSLMDNAIVLPTHRPRLLCESVLQVTDHDPLARMAALSYAVETGASPALHTPAASDKSHRFNAAPGHQRSFEAPLGAHLCCQPAAAAEMVAARQRAADLSLRVAELERASVHNAGAYEGSVARRNAAAVAISSGIGPAGRDEVLSGMGRPVLDLLESQAPIEEFIENRFLSAERYTGFMVMFHQMAETVASFKPLRWDTSRSQSCLRVATTAAPISAADLVRTWQAGTAAGLDDSSHHGGVEQRGMRRVSSTVLAFKPGRNRLGELADAFEGSVRGLRGGGPSSEGSLRGMMRSDGGSYGSYGGSMRSGAGALAAMEEGVAADLNAPWWSPQAATVTIASGVVPTEQ